MAELIAAVKKRPCLWNSDTAEYKDVATKAAAWREVLQECDIPDVREAKAKWRRLRDGHRQAISKESTRGAEWKYEKSMAFLIPYIRRRSEHATTKREYWYADKNDEDTLPNESCEEEIQNYEYASTSGLHGDPTKTVDTNSGNSKDVALEKFFETMLQMTQGLPERLQMRVQRQVFNVVMESREEYVANMETDSFD